MQINQDEEVVAERYVCLDSPSAPGGAASTKSFGSYLADDPPHNSTGFLKIYTNQDPH